MVCPIWGFRYEWLRKDLASVDRSKTPWLFVVGHHPMYCSSSGAANFDLF